MRKKPMRWLAAGMALCLTLVTTPAASAAQPPQDTPVFEEIVPYSLYIKNQGCDLMISDRTAFIEGWVSGQTGRSTECEVRVELQQKSGSFAWILVDSWTDRQDGTRASVSETVSVTPGETYRVKAVELSGPAASPKPQLSTPKLQQHSSISLFL